MVALVHEHRTEIIKCNWNLVAFFFFLLISTLSLHKPSHRQFYSRPLQIMTRFFYDLRHFVAFTQLNEMIGCIHVVSGWWSVDIADDK